MAASARWRGRVAATIERLRASDVAMPSARVVLNYAIDFTCATN